MKVHNLYLYLLSLLLGLLIFLSAGCISRMNDMNPTQTNSPSSSESPAADTATDTANAALDLSYKTIKPDTTAAPAATDISDNANITDIFPLTEKLVNEILSENHNTKYKVSNYSNIKYSLSEKEATLCSLTPYGYILYAGNDFRLILDYNLSEDTPAPVPMNDGEIYMFDSEQNGYYKYTDGSFLYVKSGSLSRPPKHDPDTPGTLPSTQTLPSADNSDSGKKVNITLRPDITIFNLLDVRLSASEKSVPQSVFVYFYDKTTEKELLFTVEYPFFMDAFCENVSTLTVYQTNFGGISGLCDGIDKSFEALQLKKYIISGEESMYCYNACKASEYWDALLSEEEIVNVSYPAENPNQIQFYFGYIEEDSQGSYSVHMLGNYAPSPSKGLTHRYEVFEKIFNRFDIGYIK